jgi:hypothetical protein
VIDVVAVDWSGARTGAALRIWVAHARHGRLLELSNGRSRQQVIEHVVHLKAGNPAGLVVGFDFSFSLPAWFLRQRGHASASDLWREVAEHGEEWLADCRPPFWGKAGDRRPRLEAHLRRTEAGAVVGGVRAKSTFQIRGAGTVGTGSIRGMPFLCDLQQAGFSIWPFDAPSNWTVIELYPRLCTGPVRKGDAVARAEYLGQSGWALSPEQEDAAITSEDAFDAAVSALCMDEHVVELQALPPLSNELDRLEGRIWDPQRPA